MISRRWLWSGVALVACAAPVLPSYHAELVSQMLIYAIFAMSLDLLVGYTGLPSLGHAAYFGCAAYAAALVTLKGGAPFWVAIPVGLVVTVMVAAVFNLLALRTARAYYLMITLALSQVLWSLAVAWTDFTGGDNGLPGVVRPTIGVPLASNGQYLWFVLGAFVLSVSAMHVLVRSPFGLALTGIRENEDRMRALGYATWRYKFLVSLAAAFFAGVAGILFMYQNSFVSPATLTVALSAQVLLMVLVGAAGTLFGSIIGAIAFVLLQYTVSSWTERWLFVVGAVYVTIALFAPRGALQWWRDRRSGPRGAR
jgi:branched-chain amino acid transport system permease protein